MERQGVANAMRDLGSRFNPPCLDFEPITVSLVDNLSVQVEQRVNSVIPTHDLVYQQVIKFANVFDPPLH
jgi:hypothetical protein